MMPGDQKELLKPGLFAPGPLSHLSPVDARFKSPLTVVRDLSEDLQKRTRAIVCTTKNTTGTIVVQQDGSADYSRMVGGDGTVPARSALNNSMLLPQSVEVDERHMTLPLDGHAIKHTINWIGRQFGVTASKSSLRAWPAAAGNTPSQQPRGLSAAFGSRR
ncbi:MAG: hypothetical protein NTV22_16050 [bacterium]|nr:hypothetical protein [bacterium]